MTSKKSSVFTGSDSRTTRNTAPTGQRGNPGLAQDVARKSADGTALTMAERKQMFRDEWNQEALPDAPEILGHHTCWLSTTNSYDPIHKRLRMGYAPVKIEEVPGLEQFQIQSGEQAGFVKCNEMVLYKIPSDIYQAIMETFHHDMPLEAQQSIAEQATAVADEDSNGKRLSDLAEDSAFSDLKANPARRPSFAP